MTHAYEGQLKRQLEQALTALAEARMWARHGYEIGQRFNGWSDYGVAPAWLTAGWPAEAAPRVPEVEEDQLYILNALANGRSVAYIATHLRREKRSVYGRIVTLRRMFGANSIEHLVHLTTLHGLIVSEPTTWGQTPEPDDPPAVAPSRYVPPQPRTSPVTPKQGATPDDARLIAARLSGWQ